MMFNKSIIVFLICFIVMIQLYCSHSHRKKHLKKYRKEMRRIQKEYNEFDRKIDWLYKRHKKYARHKKHKRYKKHLKHKELRKHRRHHHNKRRPSIKIRFSENKIPTFRFGSNKKHNHHHSYRVSKSENLIMRKYNKYNKYISKQRSINSMHQPIQTFSGVKYNNFNDSTKFIEKNTKFSSFKEFDRLENNFSKKINSALQSKNVVKELPKMINLITKPLKIQPEYLHILGSSNSKRDQEFRVKVNVKNRFEKLSIENEDDLTILDKDLKKAEEELKQSIDNYFLDPTRDGKREKVDRLKKRIQFLKNKPTNIDYLQEKLMKNYKSPIIISHDLLKHMKTNNIHYGKIEMKPETFRFSQKNNKTNNSSKLIKSKIIYNLTKVINSSNSTNFSHFSNVSYNPSNISKTSNSNLKILSDIKQKIDNSFKPNITVFAQKYNRSMFKKELLNISNVINNKKLVKSIREPLHNITSTMNIHMEKLQSIPSNTSICNDTLKDNLKFNVIKSKMNKIYNKFNYILKKIKMNKRKLEQTIQNDYYLSTFHKNKTEKFNTTHLDNIRNDTNKTVTNKSNLKNETLHLITNVTMKPDLSNNTSEYMTHFSSININDDHLISSKFIEHNRKLGSRKIDRNDEISILIKRYLDKN